MTNYRATRRRHVLARLFLCIALWSVLAFVRPIRGDQSSSRPTSVAVDDNGRLMCIMAASFWSYDGMMSQGTYVLTPGLESCRARFTVI